MHDDIVPKLLDHIQKKFDNQIQKSDVIKNLKKKLITKEATYIDVNNYAIEMGNILSNVINHHITTDVLPDGRMYYNIADRILNSTLSKNHELITHYGINVQKHLNDKAKINLKPKIPKINQNKIDGLVNRLSSEEDFEKIKWLLGDPIVTFSQGIVDDIIEENVDFHYRSGLKPQIIRKESGNCCQWCRSLVGTFTYPDVPKDVYKRHGNCRCTVEYDPKNGKKQNVHSKKWKNKKKISTHDADKELPYKSVKNEWLKKYKKPQIIDMTFWENDGIKYEVDGKYVLLNYSKREKEVAEILSRKLGVRVNMVPRVLLPSGIKTPDYLIDNEKFDLKEIEGVGKNVLDRAIKDKKEQATNFIFDVTKTDLHNDEILERINKLYQSKRREWVETIMLLEKDEIIDIFRRN